MKIDKNTHTELSENNAVLSCHSKWSGRFPLTTETYFAMFTSKCSEKLIFDARHLTQSCSPTGVLQSREFMRPWNYIGSHRIPKDPMGLISSRFLSLVSEPGKKGPSGDHKKNIACLCMFWDVLHCLAVRCDFLVFCVL